jgi:hypothetical protein
VPQLFHEAGGRRAAVADPRDERRQIGEIADSAVGD